MNRTGRKPSRPPASSALRAANAQVAGPVNVALAHMLRARRGWVEPAVGFGEEREIRHEYLHGGGGIRERTTPAFCAPSHPDVGLACSHDNC